ncbi:MAG: hypothetical protein IT449_09690 [Phycisphaerales bacterium]|nr:hypothetical protein [Phycisphaerales bacterium]
MSRSLELLETGRFIDWRARMDARLACHVVGAGRRRRLLAAVWIGDGAFGFVTLGFG